MSVADDGRCPGADRRLRMADIETATETIVVITIAFIAVGVSLAVASGFALRAARIDMAASSSWPLGSTFVNLDRPARPRGVQEEDLPRFVFRDRVPSSAGTGTTPASIDLGPALEVGAC